MGTRAHQAREQTPGLGEAGRQAHWAREVCEGSRPSLGLSPQLPGEDDPLDTQACEWKDGS